MKTLHWSSVEGAPICPKDTWILFFDRLRIVGAIPSFYYILIHYIVLLIRPRHLTPAQEG